MMRYRRTWQPAPVNPTPGQVLPALIIAALALAGLIVFVSYKFWGHQ